MPKIVVITCDICGEPAKQESDLYPNEYLCEKHKAIRELKYLKNSLQAYTNWFNVTWKDVLEEQIKQLETIIEGNKT